jgi:hypothetical protein
VLSSLLSKQVVNVLFTPGTLVDAAGDQGAFGGIDSEANMFMGNLDYVAFNMVSAWHLSVK